MIRPLCRNACGRKGLVVLNISGNKEYIKNIPTKIKKYFPSLKKFPEYIPRTFKEKSHGYQDFRKKNILYGAKGAGLITAFEGNEFLHKHVHV